MKPLALAWPRCSLRAFLPAERRRALPAVLLDRLDHLVYATPDLAVGIDTAERLFGVRASPGGQHPGEGTRNALIALGPTSYFEIIGPDPEQPKPKRARRFGIDEIRAPRLTTWVAKGADLEKFASDAAARGVNLGAVISGSRKRPDGVVLSWRYTDPRVDPRRPAGPVLHRLGRVAPSVRDRVQGRDAPQPARGTSRCGSRAGHAASAWTRFGGRGAARIPRSSRRSTVRRAASN